MVERGFLILALASNYLDVILFQEITVHEKTESKDKKLWFTWYGDMRVESMAKILTVLDKGLDEEWKNK